jgi:hypothetical protein
MISIIDNFLEEKHFNAIKDFVGHPELVWKPGRMLPEDLISCSKEENYQESYILYCNGEYNQAELNLIVPILKILEVNVLLKAKINKTIARDINMIVGWHTDMPPNHWAIDKNPKTAIFYINTNDGYTIIDDVDQKIINCVENRIVIFDSHIKHTGVTCSSYKEKLLMNINYY